MHSRSISGLEIGDLRCGGEQAAGWRPQFTLLIAVTLVENPGIGHGQQAGGIFGGKIGGLPASQIGASSLAMSVEEEWSTASYWYKLAYVHNWLYHEDKLRTVT